MSVPLPTPTSVEFRVESLLGKGPSEGTDDRLLWSRSGDTLERSPGGCCTEGSVDRLLASTWVLPLVSETFESSLGQRK